MKNNENKKQGKPSFSVKLMAGILAALMIAGVVFAALATLL